MCFSSVAGLANFIPILEKLPFDPVKLGRNLENAKVILKYCHDIIDEHVEAYDENNIDDYTSAYIKEMKRSEATGEPTTMNRKLYRFCRWG